MALMVFGVVLQQPPMREAPASRHLLTYGTKSTSEIPVDSCNRKRKEYEDVDNYVLVTWNSIRNSLK